MFLIALCWSLALVAIYLLVNVSSIMWRNYKAHQFFSKQTPNLPTIPNPSIFHGHLVQIMDEKSLKYLDEYHTKYGPTFGYFMCNQPWVSTKDLDLIKLIEFDQPYKHINRSQFGVPIKEFNHSIFQVNDERWRRIRKIISPTLTNHKVRSDEISSGIEGIIEQLLEGFEHRLNHQGETHVTKQRSTIIDIGNMFQRYVLAVIFLVTYKQTGLINFVEERDDWIDRFDESARQMNSPFIQLGMMFPFIRSTIDSLIRVHPVGRMRDQIIGFIHQATDINRIARKEHHEMQLKLSKTTGFKNEKSFDKLEQSGLFKRRLVDTIIDAFIDKKINQKDFVGTLLFLLLAGFETTADTITCLVWHLTKQPEIQEKLRKELAEKGMDCDYMSWCIQETIRWHPAVPSGVGRILGEDVTVNGVHLAKGTSVMPSIYSIHHDPNIWPEPDKFIPERWQQTANNHPAAFMGFGLGPRNCVGGKLAIHEIKLAMVALLARYRFEECASTPDEYEFGCPAWLYTILKKPITIRLFAL